jgi:hypothetical protein
LKNTMDQGKISSVNSGGLIYKGCNTIRKEKETVHALNNISQILLKAMCPASYWGQGERKGGHGNTHD